MPGSGTGTALNSIGISNSTAASLKGMVGITDKAVLEIADVNKKKIQENEAARPSGSGGGLPTGKVGKLDSFDSNLVKAFRNSLDPDGEGDDTEAYENGEKYRFIVQFNPEELSFSGYGGEELPIHDFSDLKPPKGAKKPDQPGEEQGQEKRKHPPLRSSHMAAADTRIEMTVKLTFDKTDNFSAFYHDRFNLSATTVARGAGKAVMGDQDVSVQPEIEALTAVVRDTKKRLAKFIWGDMVYEGVINSVNAEYQMFNINGEPCRATATISMVLYDAKEMGPEVEIWRKEYETDFGGAGSVKGAAGSMRVATG